MTDYPPTWFIEMSQFMTEKWGFIIYKLLISCSRCEQFDKGVTLQ